MGGRSHKYLTFYHVGCGAIWNLLQILEVKFSYNKVNLIYIHLFLKAKMCQKRGCWTHGTYYLKYDFYLHLRIINHILIVKEIINLGYFWKNMHQSHQIWRDLIVPMANPLDLVTNCFWEHESTFKRNHVY
jgi:hypothetical protein